jgi:hypothetical protein
VILSRLDSLGVEWLDMVVVYLCETV